MFDKIQDYTLWNSMSVRELSAWLLLGMYFFNYNTEEHTMREGFVILGVFCVLVGGILYFALYH